MRERKVVTVNVRVALSLLQAFVDITFINKMPAAKISLIIPTHRQPYVAHLILIYSFYHITSNEKIEKCYPNKSKFQVNISTR